MKTTENLPQPGDEFYLIFHRKEDMKKFIAKRLAGCEYKFKDPESGVTFNQTSNDVQKLYFRDKQNNRFRRPVEITAKKRRVQTGSREFQAYLRGD